MYKTPAGFAVVAGWNASPRFTTSQHAIGMTSAGCSGVNDQICGAPGFARSSAYTLLGNEECTYITLPTTSGLPSCPRSVPVDIVQAGTRSRTLPVVICVSGL